RILDSESNEVLLTVPTYGSQILLDRNDVHTVSDSVFKAAALTWRGLDTVSDWPAWRRVARRLGSTQSDITGPETFSLLDGDGFTITTGGLTVTGSPEVQLSFKDRMFISNNSVVAYAARRLAVDEADLKHLVREDLSEWAHDNAPRALSLLDPGTSYSSRVNEAIEYLRNWDYRYNVASIGAVIFDGWMLHYRPQRGSYPEILIPKDSLGLALEQSALRRSLVTAVDSLTRRAGSDLARWRLEYLRTGERYFPAWSYPRLANNLPGLMRARYEPIEIPQSGHPTTLVWQPGLYDEPANSPAYVLVRGLVGVPGSVTVRPDYEIGSGFIARYIAGPPRMGRPGADKIIDEVVLTPAN
ncbi:MAG: penicillin acylase family protein, partial [Rhodothermia bacterium]